MVEISAALRSSADQSKSEKFRVIVGAKSEVTLTCFLMNHCLPLITPSWRLFSWSSSNLKVGAVYSPKLLVGEE